MIIYDDNNYQINKIRKPENLPTFFIILNVDIHSTNGVL